MVAREEQTPTTSARLTDGTTITSNYDAFSNEIESFNFEMGLVRIEVRPKTGEVIFNGRTTKVRAGKLVFLKETNIILNADATEEAPYTMYRVGLPELILQARA